MLRIRFQANIDDYRPVHWPVKHPYWCTGYSENYATIVSYADNEQYIYDNWPEAENLTTQEVEGYTFTSRFPKPDWFDKEREP